MYISICLHTYIFEGGGEVQWLVGSPVCHKHAVAVMTVIKRSCIGSAQQEFGVCELDSC